MKPRYVPPTRGQPHKQLPPIELSKHRLPPITTPIHLPKFLGVVPHLVLNDKEYERGRAAFRWICFEATMKAKWRWE